MSGDTLTKPEASAMQDILLAHLKEQRRGRRWKIFFRMLIVLYVTGITILMFKDVDPKTAETMQKHVAVVDLSGEISAASNKGASADHLIRGLKAAFEADNTVAVMLRINSPGGSPVQSAQVYREITRLRELNPDKPVYAFAEDIAASGAYYIASAADRIYADPASLVGSVGVIMSGFGFSDIMNTVGVERRVYTAGKHKAFMDPFSKESPASIDHVETLLDDIHHEFISAVRNGRGDRVKGSNEDLFNGLIWTGNQAKELGLVDGIGSVREIARSEFKTDTLVDYSYKPNPLERLAGRISAEFAGALVKAAGGDVHIR